MRTRNLITLLALALAAGATGAANGAPGSEAGSPRPASAVLLEDARLRRPVSLALATRPLAEAMAALERQVGLPIKADPVPAAVKATLYLDRRPASEVMSRIARHFDFEWKRSGTGYRLVFSPAARLRETKLREAELAAQLGALREHVSVVVELLREPRPRLEARRQELKERLAMHPADPAERARLLDEQAVVADALQLGAGAAAAILRAARPDQLLQLRPGRDLQFSTFDGTLEPALAQQVHGVIEELMRGTPWALDPETRQADAVIRLAVNPSPRFDPTTAHGYQVALQVGMLSGDRTRYRPFAWMPAPVPESIVPLAATPVTDALLKREMELRFPSPAAAEGPRRHGWPAGLVPLGELAAALHRETGLEVIADGSIRARMKPETVSGRMTAGDLLERVARDLRFDWKLDRGVVMLRSRTHFRDRPAEVPAPVVARFRRQLEADKNPTLGSLAELAAAVDEDQAQGLRDYWGWYFEGLPAAVPAWAETFFGNRYPLRLWMTLLPDQRRAAEAGEPAPLRVVSAQAQLFQEGLATRGGDGFSPRRYPAVLQPVQLAASGFSREAREIRQQKFRITTERGSLTFTEELDAQGRPPRIGSTVGQAEPVGDPVTVQAVTFRFHLPGIERPLRFPRINFGQ